MIKHSRLGAQLLSLLLLAASFTACKDDAVDPATPPAKGDEAVTANEKVNTWVYETMKEVYLWTDELPTQVNLKQDPQDLFKSLLSSKDRFSFITPDYQGLISSLSGVSKDAGYEFLLARASETNEDVLAVVLYVKHNSPAKAAGLKRGDVITKLNGTTINMTNYRSLLGKLGETHTIDYRRYNNQLAQFENKNAITLNPVELAENPNFMDSVYVTPSGKRVGYYVYNFFSPGTGTSKEYDQQMDAIIAEFKSKGINELVLDLRYNSGGAISSATNLASLIGKGVDNSKVFYQNRWNKLYQDYISGLSNGDDILRGKFIDKGTNIGNDLSSGKVYVLVGSRTASASELIINGLRPYMQVEIIGETTVGKNVGSIPIEDKENPENKYGLLPIVFQISNSQGQSDYANGFVPTSVVKDFQLPMLALGDINEPLLAKALSSIDPEIAKAPGTTAGLRVKREEVTPITSSIDQKLRSNRLIMDSPLF